jgi:hypothetical protein
MEELKRKYEDGVYHGYALLHKHVSLDDGFRKKNTCKNNIVNAQHLLPYHKNHTQRKDCNCCPHKSQRNEQLPLLHELHGRKDRLSHHSTTPTKGNEEHGMRIIDSHN